MSEHTIGFCPTCGGIKVTPPYPPNPTTAAYPGIDKACRCETEYDVQSELTAIRSQVEELQRQLDEAAGQKNKEDDTRL